MSDNSIDEISRLLFVSFSEDNKVEISNLIRLWSLELQWMEPNDAQLVINELLDKGWLVNENNILTPVSKINKILPELGWRPIFRVISNPPVFVPIISDSTSIVPEILKSKVVVEVIQSTFPSKEVTGRPPDRSEGNIPSLIKLISLRSKIDNREIVRRAQRKRRSLGTVTLWMALALVAREQGLDMVEIVSVIEAI
jgi:hypothetical protein|tara:strand:+ start:11069 stop:11659 length:591 start_codon:yes stop_codon:yes gene_type:complete